MSSTYAPETAPTSAPKPKTHGVSVFWRALKVLASLQLTVGLFSLAMFLVFFGTLAQIDKGIWTVVDQYFRSWYVWVPVQLFAEFGIRFFEVPPETVWKGSFPFPGGWLLGGVMLGNLIAAHLVRFKLTWKRAGIIIIHAGVIVLMLGELVTGMYAVESRMVIQVGETMNFIDHSRNVELAIIEESKDGTNRVVTIPQSMLTTGAKIQDDSLPVDIEVVEFLKNSELNPLVGGDDSNAIIRIDGIRYSVSPASEGSGVKSEREDAAAARIKIFRKPGKNEAAAPELLKEHFFSLWEYENYQPRTYMSLPVRVDVDGKSYRVQLRNARTPTPFSIELKEFQHKFHAGTSNPRDFTSIVRLEDPEMGVVRDDIRVWMNHPLFHRGETFYQASFAPGDTGTVLQVVRNPGWMLPYISCVMVALGMLIHFGLNLQKFMERRAAA